MKRIIDISEDDFKRIEKIKFLIGGKYDAKLQLHVINAFKSSTPLNEVEAEDCISRKDVERLVYQYLRKGTDDNVAFYENFLDLPSVTPKIEPRKGHWIRVAGGSLIDDYRCNCCNHQPPIRKVGSTWGWDFTDYCPNCGAKIVEPQESEEI